MNGKGYMFHDSIIGHNLTHKQVKIGRKIRKQLAMAYWMVNETIVFIVYGIGSDWMNDIQCADIPWRHVCNSFSIYFLWIRRSENIIKREEERRRTKKSQRNALYPTTYLMECLIRITKAKEERTKRHKKLEHKEWKSIWRMRARCSQHRCYLFFAM